MSTAMEAKNWSIKFDDVVAEGENLAVELFDPSMGVKELRNILDPYIVKGAEGAEYVAEEGYATLFRAVANYSKRHDWHGYCSCSILSCYFSWRSDFLTLLKVCVLNRGSRAVFNAEERVKDNLMYLMKTSGYYTLLCTKKES